MFYDAAHARGATGTPCGLVHIGGVLNCLARAVAIRREAISAKSTLLIDVLLLLGLEARDANTIDRMGIKWAHEEHQLPVRMTMGAAVALHVAQRSEQLGLPDDVVAANVARVVCRIVDRGVPRSTQQWSSRPVGPVG